VRNIDISIFNCLESATSPSIHFEMQDHLFGTQVMGCDDFVGNMSKGMQKEWSIYNSDQKMKVLSLTYKVKHKIV